MTFLCPSKSRASVATVAISEAPASGSGKKGNAKGQANSEVSSGVVWAEAIMQTNIGGKAILPTFLMTIQNIKFRCLKDTGCQPHFIETALAESLDLPVKLTNYSVTVNGFNEGKTYSTKVVSVPLKVDDKEVTVRAICVPKIKTHLKLPGLQRVARGFADRGYVLADPSLLHGDEIGDIRFVLGMSDPEVLLEKPVVFGDPPSVFSETAAGVLLYGTVDRLRSNLPLLPGSAAAGGGSSECSAASKVCIHSLACKNQTVTHPEIERVSSNLGTVNSNISVLKDNGRVDVNALAKATDEVLTMHCEKSLGYDSEVYREDSTASNEEIVNYVLDNTDRTNEGRLTMPLIWKKDVAQFLGKNNFLSRQILMSLKRLSIDKLAMMDDSIKEWENSGIVERVEDLPAFLTVTPVHSFLPHMAVFRMGRETTKCRVVFLSNLCEKSQTVQWP